MATSNNKLYIGSLSYDTTNDGLKDFFASAGNVTSASVIIDKFSNRSRGFGFVEMETAEEAQNAIKELDGKELDGRTISVSIAREKTEGDRPRGGGGGYGGNRGGGGYGNRGNNGGGSFRFR